MTIPHAIFGGLALIALSIYFSVGSLPVNANSTPQKVVLCDDKFGLQCGTPQKVVICDTKRWCPELARGYDHQGKFSGGLPVFQLKSSPFKE